MPFAANSWLRVQRTVALLPSFLRRSMQEASDREVSSLFAKLMPHQCGGVIGARAPNNGEGGDMCCRKQLATPLAAAAASRNALPPPPVVVVPDNFHSGGDGDCDERCGQLSEKGTDPPFVVAGPRCCCASFLGGHATVIFFDHSLWPKPFFHCSSISPLLQRNGECDKRDWHRCHEEAEDC